MKWSPQQQSALNMVGNWLKSDQQIFRLFGYAGTGKTTLARHIADQMDGTTRFAAYTGKAAHVLSTKGCPATTLHKLVYVPKGRSKERLRKLQAEYAQLVKDKAGERYLKELQAEINKEEENSARVSFQVNFDSVLRHETDLLIIDECSMVDEAMARDILDFGMKVLVLGDPAQLPPVFGKAFFTDADPNMLLTEIHRQAQESPIIDLATKARNRQFIQPGTYGDCRVFDGADKLTEIALEADQILCGRNRTRHGVNRRMRSLLGRTSELPVAEDRMVCLRNDSETGLLNGQIWICSEDSEDTGLDTYELTAYNSESENQQGTFTTWRGEPPTWGRTDAQEFNYAYALTTHKAQGSQWDRVLVMDESNAFGRDKHRWLYTAITRAAEQLDIVKME